MTHKMILIIFLNWPKLQPEKSQIFFEQEDKEEYVKPRQEEAAEKPKAPAQNNLYEQSEADKHHTVEEYRPKKKRSREPIR